MAVESTFGIYGYLLRPVEIRDAEKIHKLRTNPEVSQHLNPTTGGVEAQEEWIAQQRNSANDYYFIVEAPNEQFEGVIGLYNLAGGKAEWGRWVLRKGSLATPACVLGIFQFAFERLKLNRIYCRTLESNIQVVKLHDSFAYSSKNTKSDIDGRVFIEHVLLHEDWDGFFARLSTFAERIQARIENQ